MTSWEIKGWCPGALRPMASGDGLVVRVRPPLGRLSPDQATAIARVALAHGNGIVDLSARANLQLRGVTADSHGPLIEDLRQHGLIDPDIATESLRNLIVTPFRDGDPDADDSIVEDPTVGGAPKFFGRKILAGTDDLAATLTAALARMPRLPGKFGFALDTGPRPVLTGASVDIRVERSKDGRLILRPEGFALGKPVTDLAEDAIAMAEWFIAQGGVSDGRGRMAALVARGIRPEGCDTAPADPLPQPAPGLHPQGALVALAFGQMRAETLLKLAALGHEIRPTPWRMLFLVGARTLPDRPDLITDPAHPLLRVIACTGAPACPQALGDTRQLARALAGDIPADTLLHISGCAKGCAHPGVAPLTLTATATGYDLIRNGAAHDTPSLSGLPPEALPDLLKAPNAPHL